MHHVRLVLSSIAATAVLVVVPLAGSAVADPLPPGSYAVTLTGEDDAPIEVTIEVTEDGTAVVDDLDGVDVALTYDGAGTVQDTVWVRTADGVHLVEIEVDEHGYVPVVTEADDDDFPGDAVATGEGEDGAPLVATVAACAPTGWTAREAGVANHGWFVSAAAHGDVVTVALPGAGEDPGDVEPTTAGEATVEVDFDLATDDGVAALCDGFATLLDDDDDGADASDGEDDVSPPEVDADDDGGDDGDDGDDRGEAVSLAAGCSPTGRTARDADLPSHGEVVSAVARSLPVLVGDTEHTTASTDDVVALCAALAEHATAAAPDAVGRHRDDGDTDAPTTDADGDDARLGDDARTDRGRPDRGARGNRDDARGTPDDARGTRGRGNGRD